MDENLHLSSGSFCHLWLTEEWTTTKNMKERPRDTTPDCVFFYLFPKADVLRRPGKHAPLIQVHTHITHTHNAACMCIHFPVSYLCVFTSVLISEMGVGNLAQWVEQACGAEFNPQLPPPKKVKWQRGGCIMASELTSFLTT